MGQLLSACRKTPETKAEIQHYSVQKAAAGPGKHAGDIPNGFEVKRTLHMD
jgi:hypothetical protein